MIVFTVNFTANCFCVVSSVQNSADNQIGYWNITKTSANIKKRSIRLSSSEWLIFCYRILITYNKNFIKKQWGMCVSSASGTAIQNFLISYPKYCLFMLPYSDEIVGLDIESIKNVTPIDTNRFYCVSRNPQTGQYNQNQFGYVAFGI